MNTTKVSGKHTKLQDIANRVLKESQLGEEWYTEAGVLLIESYGVTVRIPPVVWGYSERVANACLLAYLVGYLNAISDYRERAATIAATEELNRLQIVRH